MEKVKGRSLLVYEDSIRRVYFDEETKVLFSRIVSMDNSIPSDQLIQNLEKFSNLIPKLKPKYLLADNRNYSYYDSDGSVKNHYLEVLAPRMKAAGVERAAVVMPDSLNGLAYLDNLNSEIIETNPDNIIEFRFFEDPDKAFEWLIKN